MYLHSMYSFKRGSSTLTSINPNPEDAPARLERLASECNAALPALGMRDLVSKAGGCISLILYVLYGLAAVEGFCAFR